MDEPQKPSDEISDLEVIIKAMAGSASPEEFKHAQQVMAAFKEQELASLAAKGVKDPEKFYQSKLKKQREHMQRNREL